MYGYNRYVSISEEAILHRAKQEDIFRIVIDDEILTDGEKYYTAPYRVDTEPNCIFEYYGNVLYFCDWGAEKRTNKNCIEFIKSCYNVPFLEALEIINTELSLGLGDSTERVKKPIEINKEVSTFKKKKVSRSITILPRKFTDKDKLFWSKYGITKKNLIADKVTPIKLYQSINKEGKPFTMKHLSITYAFTDFPDGRKKIYCPYSDQVKGKWFTNCTQNDIGGLYLLRKDVDKLVITKSYKDWRVIINQGVNAIWFQNEGMIPNQDILSELIVNYTEIIIWFDNDSTGIAKARVIREYLTSLGIVKIVRMVFLPPKLVGENITDASDFREKKGKAMLKQFIDKKNLLNN